MYFYVLRNIINEDIIVLFYLSEFFLRYTYNTPNMLTRHGRIAEAKSRCNNKNIECYRILSLENYNDKVPIVRKITV